MRKRKETKELNETNKQNLNQNKPWKYDCRTEAITQGGRMEVTTNQENGLFFNGKWYM